MAMIYNVTGGTGWDYSAVTSDVVAHKHGIATPTRGLIS